MSSVDMPAPVRMWLAAPLTAQVQDAINRLRRAPDVAALAVMPDVHLAADVCIGVAVATSSLLYPQAVGGDIGCGMLAVALDGDAAALANPALAGRILADLGKALPPRRRNRSSVLPQPDDVATTTLSHPSLERLRHDDGALEFATPGSGNHFIEIQAGEENDLWLMVHSGSRAMGPAIRDHHLARATFGNPRLRALDADSIAGADYLHDAAWARRFAAASRHAMAEVVGCVLRQHLGAHLRWDTCITTDHNHVARECHGDRSLWVHRKGAMPAARDQPGMLPGSMGSWSFHVQGRGCEAALCSSAHGAGRAMSRTEARAKITEREFHRQMAGVWYNPLLAGRLIDEAPAAYKDIRAVLRAQKDLVKVVRRLRPLLSYKAA